ncbi:ArsR family transcriptional regulator [Arthrobacter sp. CAU 1506]|uniref:winged helix-turn-helix domain-containing protein n=1 Tax=Arthrobacter sp. CAU 1506 TaxID=2560052 RepID=UPI0010AD13D1|nr:helix-turn-helix domain-containing protein [Arthrobacter sp. CAU 1506]TJY72481.1 ArsR family transcriptional regulator [Arthrobacter sp. CAU 1506]
MQTTNDDGDARPSETRPGHQNAPGEQVVSDPVHIRALTHPLRLELLDVLDGAGQATATECAAATGESVASCSYHLRILAKHGYIEPGERAGRDKPWKPVSRSRAQTIDHTLPGSRHAVVALADLELERQFQRLRAWTGRAADLPANELDLSVISSTQLYATPDEIKQLRDDLLKLSRRFEGRAEDPSLRPQGARKTHLFSVLNPDPGQP